MPEASSGASDDEKVDDRREDELALADLLRFGGEECEESL